MKQNLFTPARFLHYLRKDWSENRIQFLYDLVFPYSILTLLFLATDFGRTQSVVKALRDVAQGGKTRNNSYLDVLEHAAQGIDDCWGTMGFMTLLCFMLYLAFRGSTFFLSSKHRRGYISDLTLPASAPEKALARWLRTALVPLPLFMVSVVLADYTRIGIMHLAYPEVSLSFPTPWNGVWENFFLAGITQAYPLQALFILGATYWRKKPFPKTLSAVLLLALLFYGTYYCNVTFLIGTEYDYHSAPHRWFHGWWKGIDLFVLLFGYVLAYLRMRRASLRVSWKDGTTLALLAAVLIGLGLCLWMPHHVVAHFGFR